MKMVCFNMCILIDEKGKIYTNENVINRLLSPVTIGSFPISNEAKNFIENELNDANVDRLFHFIPDKSLNLCQNKKLIPTKASIFKEQAKDIAQSRSITSQTPHINAGDEIHFFFDGSYIIYFNINNQHFSLVVQRGDWLFISASVEHWIKGTEDHYLIIVSYHSEPFELFHSKVQYTDTKSHAYL